MHPQVFWVLSRQLAVAVVAAVVAGLAGGAGAAISALIGGGIGFVSSYAYVWRAGRNPGGDPQRLYRAQAMGEAYKFASTFALFALVFIAYREVAVLPLFAAYVATLAVYWAALLKQR